MSQEQVDWQALLDVVNRAESMAAAMEIEEAGQFIVMSINTETGLMSFVGGFTDPIEAMGFANRWAEELNHVSNDPPYMTQVYPMFAPYPEAES